MSAHIYLPMKRPSARLASLFAALACCAGCAGPLDHFRQLDVGAIRPDQVLLLGKVHIQWLDEAMATSTWLRAGKDDLQYPLPESEQVAWLVPRPRGALRIWGIETRQGWIRLGVDPVLMTADARGSIVYFGTIYLTATTGQWSTRLRPTFGTLRLRVLDEADETLGDFVELNPSLGGRPYYHLLRATLVDAPPALPPASKEPH